MRNCHSSSLIALQEPWHLQQDCKKRNNMYSQNNNNFAAIFSLPLTKVTILRQFQILNNQTLSRNTTNNFFYKSKEMAFNYE